MRSFFSVLATPLQVGLARAYLCFVPLQPQISLTSIQSPSIDRYHTGKCIRRFGGKFNSIICRFFAPNSQDNAFSLLHVWGAKNRQMMLLNFLIISYYLMLNQIFPRLSTKIVRILHKLGENNHLNSNCRSQT